MCLISEVFESFSRYHWNDRKEVEKRENRLTEYFSGCLPNHILGFISILNTPVAAKAGKLWSPLEGGGDFITSLRRRDITSFSCCFVFPLVVNKDILGEKSEKAIFQSFSRNFAKQWVWFTLQMWFPVFSHIICIPLKIVWFNFIL